MDMVIEILVEAFFELFVEGFLTLRSAFVPDKALSPRGRQIAGIVCLILSIVLLVGLFAGIIFLLVTDGQSVWGWVLLSVGVLYVVSGILLKIIAVIKKK